MVDVIPPDSEGVRVPAIQADGIVSRLVDLVAFEGDVVPPNEVDPAVSPLEVQGLHDKEGRVDDIDVVLVVGEVDRLGPRDDRVLPIGGTDRNWGPGRAVYWDRPPTGLRVGPAMKDQHIP